MAFSKHLVYTASSVQLDFVAQIYVAIRSYSSRFYLASFPTIPGFVWLLPYSSILDLCGNFILF